MFIGLWMRLIEYEDLISEKTSIHEYELNVWIYLSESYVSLKNLSKIWSLGQFQALSDFIEKLLQDS